MPRKKLTKKRAPGPFGIYLSQLRRSRGFTQLELSRAVGCGSAYIHKLESGIRDVPQTILLCKLSLVLGVPLHQMLTNGKLIPRCDSPELLDDTVEILDSWRAQVRVQDSIQMVCELVSILSRNRSRMASDIHHLFDNLTKHVNVLDAELHLPKALDA